MPKVQAGWIRPEQCHCMEGKHWFLQLAIATTRLFLNELRRGLILQDTNCYPHSSQYGGNKRGFPISTPAVQEEQEHPFVTTFGTGRTQLKVRIWPSNVSPDDDITMLWWGITPPSLHKNPTVAAQPHPTTHGQTVWRRLSEALPFQHALCYFITLAVCCNK